MIHRLTIAISIIFILHSTVGFSASNVACDSILEQLNLDSGSLDQAIEDLAALKLSLDLAKVASEKSTITTTLEFDYKKKEQTILEYLEKNKLMTKKEFVEKIKKEISRIQKNKIAEAEATSRKTKDKTKLKEEQEKQINDVTIDGTRAIFQRIEPGPFKMGNPEKQVVDAEISKPFEMMATLVTQQFYRKIIELSSVRYPGTSDLKSDPSEVKGELNPVEHISYRDVQTWIALLNQLSLAGEPMLHSLIPEHKKGDVYRLPSEAEWEFVIRGRGEFSDKYPFGMKNTNFRDHAWYEINSGKTTHPVAQKNPISFEGNEFYDMHGNVWEWVQDTHGHWLSGGTDPQGAGGDGERVIRGGSYVVNWSAMKSSLRSSAHPADSQSFIGFRLVRVVK